MINIAKHTPFEIRKAQTSDAKTISDLLRQLGYQTEAATVEGFISQATHDTNHVFVGVLDKQVIAVMSLIFFNYFPSAEKLCRITAIVVDENIRGSGIGSTLIDHAQSLALEEHCTLLEVTTSLQRTQTQAYYESIGFQKTSYKYVKSI